MEEELTLTFEQWKTPITSADSKDRSHAADNPPDDGDPQETVRLLLHALNDTDELVRACAADSMSFYSTDESRAGLRARLSVESDKLASAYLLSSLSDIGELEDAKRIIDAIAQETAPIIQILAVFGLMNFSIRIGMPALIERVRGGEAAGCTKSLSTLSELADIFQYQLGLIHEEALRLRAAPPTDIAKGAIERILASIDGPEAVAD